jgi:trehalose synthase
MKRVGAVTVWRSHVGSDVTDEHVDAAWTFLRPYVEPADATVFTRKAYVPVWADADRVYIIPPSIDPFSVKNQDMPPATVRAIVAHVGLTNGSCPDDDCTFLRRDGSPGRVDHRADVIRTGPPPSPEQPLVVQVSRWDRLKDMAGVMQGFAEHVDGVSAAHLALVGPNVSGVADDPEGAEVLDECVRAWRELPHAARSRIQLVCLPMYDLEENAAIVNAVQRHARVVVQKSLAEGFGLTVAEALWKAKPVVASAIGGIRDQITDGEHGLLVEDPTDLAAFGHAVRRLLEDRPLAERLARQGKQRATAEFLGTRHLLQYGAMFAELLR